MVFYFNILKHFENWMVLAKDNIVYYYIAFEKDWNPFSFIDQKDYKRKL